MSSYGNTPPDPYGQQPPSGDPYGQQGYGQSPYAQQQGHGQQAYGAPVTYAHWGKRVGAYIIDAILTNLAAIPLWIGYGMLIASVDPVTDPETGVTTATGDPSGVSLALMALGVLTYLGFFIWNTFIKQGRTGYTIGKGVLGIKLVSEQTGQPVGAGMSFVRQLAHILDSICLLGYLWPLWDAKRQTFADKVMKSVVIDQPKG